MIVLQTIAVAFAMFSALPVPQFEWNEKNMRYAMCAFPLIGWSLRRVVVAVRRSAPADARKSGGVLPGSGLGHGRHPPGRLRRHLRRPFQLWRPGKKLEILKDPHCGAFAVIRLCSYFAAYLALCACVRSRPGWASAGRWPLCWNGHSRAGRGSVPDGKEHRPCPHLCHGGGRTTVRRVLRCWPLCCAALAALGGWALVLAALLVFGAIMLWRESSLAASPAIWPGGFCRRPSCGCWRRCGLPVGRTMMFITGPLYSGKRTFAQGLPGTRIAEVQALAAEAEDPEKLAGGALR